MGDQDTQILPHYSCYLDTNFYTKIYDKSTEASQNVPVEIKGIDVWWMLNTREGKRFLRKLSEC